ncbi:farnesol dehydrogenase-like [Chrysoperla carnea]|uniref:farnesol dehydrogenase-like n=1 Tax=Chrysoperla carnea TaxID=189513 RepID=UPI001D0960A0|nr:farnesol dehydrogenase-like [Chrysoperla carnea]
MQPIAGQVALVTGASSGIGAALVKLLVKNGMKVVGVARRKDRLLALSNELKNESGEFHYLQVDMTKEDDIKKVFEFIQDKFSVLHALVNNAGVVRLDSTLKDGSTESWRQVLDTNVIGVSIATREAVRLMRKTNADGYIIHINSVLGLGCPLPVGKYANMYIASKHAVTAMTETLRQELLDENLKIRVSSICPGVVETEMIQSVKGTPMEKALSANAPSLKAIDVAETVLFLLTRPSNVEITQLTIKPKGELI